MARNKEALIVEVIKMIDYPLNEERMEILLEEFDEHLAICGSSEYSLKIFAKAFNVRLCLAEAEFLSLAKGEG